MEDLKQFLWRRRARFGMLFDRRSSGKFNREGPKFVAGFTELPSKPGLDQ
jgi:hypothetical protein